MESIIDHGILSFKGNRHYHNYDVTPGYQTLPGNSQATNLLRGEGEYGHVKRILTEHLFHDQVFIRTPLHNNNFIYLINFHKSPALGE